jgi:RNA polymerase sigma-B factor
MAHDWPVRSLHDRHQERLLFRRYRMTGDAATRELIVKRYLGLAATIAARYNHTGVPHDDRTQLASLALVKAIDRFDPERGVAFSAFAVPTMIGELKRYFRDHTWTVRPPRDLQEAVLRLGRTTESLTAGLGRTPTTRELARTMGLTLEEVLETIEASQAFASASLDEPAGPDQHETLAAIIGAEDAQFGRVENRVLAEDLLSELTPREQHILRLRFEQDLTQSEIAVLVGRSQIQVSRIIRAALDQLSASAAAERSEILACI